MKRSSLLASALTLVLILSIAFPSLAAGTLTIEEDRLAVLRNYDDTYRGEVFAVVRNTGDETVMVEQGSMKLLGPDGTELYNSAYLDVYPRLLAPGESGLISIFGFVPTATTPDAIASYELDFTIADNTYIKVTSYPASATYEIVEDLYWTYAQVVAEVENNTDQPAYDIKVAITLRDEAGALLTILNVWTFEVGIPAGSSMLVKSELSDELFTYLNENNLTPTEVEVIAFIEEYSE